ncbi:MAG: hypothetical protein GDA51_11490 [Ekhidna sp.]|nr:hypothetical protein [Ekhidna sp.]MBC6409255.1 hypothetical protein [Ekhidna sp.]MBC6427060.1 hypothetical protein [Ekhidna sp.]
MNKEELSQVHIEIIEDIILESLYRAAVSMEQMLKIRIKPKIMGFGLGPIKKISEFDDLGRFKVNLMRVAFRGEINGALYFVINNHEMDLINKVNLPESVVTTRNTQTKMMKHDFMSEIENLIANQSIAALSEFLGVRVIPEVPVIRNMRGDLVNDYLKNENEQINTRFYVKSTLTGAVVNISPYFLWLIDENFLRISKLNIVT